MAECDWTDCSRQRSGTDVKQEVANGLMCICSSLPNDDVTVQLDLRTLKLPSPSGSSQVTGGEQTASRCQSNPRAARR
ncbi:hypothetical protein SKAU_G00014100 [Synaphobranchus kaupii]|uniref:Uncharacterized protein n=1 Tax=Synaphobranchus kaupii TaxID=118154 RepID=A0A9Q1GAT6_SYNKA|nr:hypothetical protein SKAU_G00014100 [Synaphobranchus kaupii]